MYTAPRRPKKQRRLEDRELNHARSKPDTVDRPVRTARSLVHHYNSTQYSSADTVFLIFLLNIPIPPDQHHGQNEETSSVKRQGSRIGLLFQ